MNFEKYHNFKLRVNACGCQVHICLISSHHSDTENRLQLHNLSDLNNIIIQHGKSTEKLSTTRNYATAIIESLCLQPCLLELVDMAER